MDELNKNESVEPIQVNDNHKAKFSWKRLLITAGFVILTAGVVGGGIWYLMDQDAKKEKEATAKSIQTLENTVKELKSSSNASNNESKNQEGTIEGSLGYPSGGGIPTTMTIYAEKTGGSKTYNTSVQIKDDSYKYGVGYKLSVPAGEYYIYGMVPDFNDSNGAQYKAYYDKFVTCGLSIECKDFSKIAVTVTTGKTTSGIDIFDWYPTK